MPSDVSPWSTVRVHPPDRSEHSRTPAYVGSRSGRVLLDLGVHPLPASAARREEPPVHERLYTVEFSASELFGSGTHRVHVDVYGSSLEVVDGR